ncbi:hypothetical protein FIV01_20535 (plasmid) [Vibrio aquimaris]|uniref:Phage tail fibre protein N-terminal domain-containing protein n=2 Tax=Vibrio aquimaris TaxID=2587862 RepID=A0A5P9CSZ5_9VIBR|nr:hypothetical protein FIV01_20535 [Vibrio aquimaris]
MVTHEDNTTLLTFKGDIPVDRGGFHINEVAIRLEDGTLYNYARSTGDYKPTPEQGATESIRYVVDMYTTNAEIIECKVDLSSVYSDYEDLEAVRVEGANNLQAHVENSNPHSQYPLLADIQFALYQEDRVYKCGEVCCTITAGKVSYWEWYSNVESLAGKNPLDDVNRQSGWTDDTKPFYWSPYKKARTGTPLFPWMSMTFPEGTLNVLGNSVPVAVFWRLAAALPEFVNAGTGMIDFPETGGEFFRVLDQGRGIDPNRTLASWQKGTAAIVNDHYEGHVMGIEADSYQNLAGIRESAGLDKGLYSDYSNIRGAFSSAVGSYNDFMNVGSWGGGVSRPRNLAFPILVEV